MKHASVFTMVVYEVIGMFLLFRSSCKYIMNRWYIFRDEPDWYVKKVMRIKDGPADRNQKEINQMVKEARDEMKLRSRRRYLGYYS